MSNQENEVFSRPNTEAKIHDLEQFTLWTDPVEKGGKRPRLVFGERNGAPRITVYPGQEAVKVVWIGFGPVEFEMFLSAFERIASGENGKESFIDNLDRDPNSDKRDPNPANKVVRNRMQFGKDANGICWIAFQQKNLKPVRFTIVPNGWHNFYHEGGAKLTESEASTLYTRGLINILRRVYGHWATRIRQPMARGQMGASSPDQQQQSYKESAMTTISTFDNDVQF